MQSIVFFNLVKLRENQKSEKVKGGYMKQIKQTLVIRRRKIILGYYNSGRTSLGSGDQENHG